MKQSQAIIEAQNENPTQTDNELMVDALAKLKDIATFIIKSKHCTKTDATMLRKVYSNILLKVNQTSIF